MANDSMCTNCIVCCLQRKTAKSIPFAMNPIHQRQPKSTDIRCNTTNRWSWFCQLKLGYPLSIRPFVCPANQQFNTFICIRNTHLTHHIFRLYINEIGQTKRSKVTPHATIELTTHFNSKYA